MSWTRYAAPQRFYPLAGRVIPWCAGLALVLAPLAAAAALRIAVE